MYKSLGVVLTIRSSRPADLPRDLGSSCRKAPGPLRIGAVSSCATAFATLIWLAAGWACAALGLVFIRSTSVAAKRTSSKHRSLTLQSRGRQPASRHLLSSQTGRKRFFRVAQQPAGLPARLRFNALAFVSVSAGLLVRRAYACACRTSALSTRAHRHLRGADFTAQHSSCACSHMPATACTALLQRSGCSAIVRSGNAARCAN